MPYQIDWQIPQSVLTLQLDGHVTYEEFVEIDKVITDHLNTVNVGTRIALIINANNAKSVPPIFNELKTSQSYAVDGHNARVGYILVVSGGNKLMRLMMMLIYNLCRPSLRFFDTSVEAERFLSTVNIIKLPRAI